MHSNDAQMLVLTVLADGPAHGYAINTAIERLTGTRLGPGSLYGALARLESRHLIEPTGEAAGEPTGEPTGKAAGQRHRTVRITDEGRTTLRAELERMARISQSGLRALGLPQTWPSQTWPSQTWPSQTWPSQTRLSQT